MTIINIFSLSLLDKVWLRKIKKNMANVTIDGVDYNLDDLSEDAKKQLVSLQFAQSEIQRLENKLAITRTAAVSYSNSLKSQLEK